MHSLPLSKSDASHLSSLHQVFAHRPPPSVSLACRCLTRCIGVSPTLVIGCLFRFSTVPHYSDKVRYWRTLHNGPDTVEELMDRHLVKEKPSYDDDESDLLYRQRLISTRREALGLYRDILRATRFFMWPDPRGVLWREVLRENARKEFEEARFEKDPEVITRLLIGGRDAVQAALDKLAEKQRAEIEKEKGSRI